MVLGIPQFMKPPSAHRLLGDIHYQPTTHCYGWTAEMYLMFSIGVGQARDDQMEKVENPQKDGVTSNYIVSLPYLIITNRYLGIYLPIYLMVITR